MIKSSKELKKEERGKFEYALEKHENIVICRWNDNNIVTIASNSSTILPTSNVSRFSQKEKKLFWYLNLT